jgi:hypothetical protein
MIHRGVQYSRAIRTYYKKFGRYPARMEDLDNTNNLRFLRKHYKDPITGKDFKLLHYGEVKMTLGSPLAGGGINGATSLNGNNASNASSPFGATPGTPPASPSQASPVSPLSAPGTDSGDPNQPTDPKQPTTAAAPAQQSSASEDKLAGQTFGGAPIVGVVSTSKKDGIRSFSHKSKYSDWQFIYDPASDRGGLLNSPNQPPPLQSLTTQPGQNGQPGNPSNSPFGPAPGNNPNPTPPANPNPGNPLLGPPVDQQ